MNPIKLEKDPEGGYKVTQGNLDSGCLAPDLAEAIAKQIASPEGEKVITDIIHRNKGALAKALDDGWIEWNGVKCPVPFGTRVDVELRNGEVYCNRQAWGAYRTYEEDRATETFSEAGAEFWRNDNHERDIVRYRLHKPEIEGTENEGSDHD